MCSSNVCAIVCETADPLVREQLWDMGKNQHSKDGLHLRPTEWTQDHGGFKDKKRSPYAQLPLHCCMLSLQPFLNPVGTRDGAVFELKNILAYVKKYKVNPVTGGKMDVKELFPLRFHRNKDDHASLFSAISVSVNHVSCMVSASLMCPIRITNTLSVRRQFDSFAGLFRVRHFSATPTPMSGTKLPAI